MVYYRCSVGGRQGDNEGGNEMGYRPKLGTPCRDCGDTTVQLSQSWLCPTCSLWRMLEAFDQIRDKEGPIYEKWADRLIAAVQRRVNHG